LPNGFKTLADLNLLDSIEDQDKRQDLRSKILENSTFNTTLEPAWARRLLPCLDEPCFKGIFNTEIRVHHSSHRAISNTPVKSEREEEGSKWVTFHPTPLMSTYLLCVTIGKYEEIKLETNNNIEVCAYAPVGYGYTTKYFLEIASKSLDFYVEYFG
jgi:aminopeptidase N